MSNGRDPVGQNATPDSAGELAALRVAGRVAVAARNHGVAIESFARAEAIAPDHEPTRLALGVALQGAGRHEEALARLQRVGDGAPEKGAAELHSSLSLLALGRALPARDAARRTVALTPRSIRRIARWAEPRPRSAAAKPLKRPCWPLSKSIRIRPTCGCSSGRRDVSREISRGLKRRCARPCGSIPRMRRHTRAWRLTGGIAAASSKSELLPTTAPLSAWRSTISAGTRCSRAYCSENGRARWPIRPAGAINSSSSTTTSRFSAISDGP